MIPTRVRLSVAAYRQTRPLAALHHGTRHWPGAADGSADAGMNALQITDPLMIYQSKVARGELEGDEEQLKALVKVSVCCVTARRCRYAQGMLMLLDTPYPCLLISRSYGI